MTTTSAPPAIAPTQEPPAQTAPITSRRDFRDSQHYWHTELQYSERFLRDWHLTADRTVERFLAGGNRQRNDFQHTASRARMNLFHTDQKIIHTALFDRLPQLQVKRTFDDPHDDPARVAALLLQRAMQNDTHAHAQEYQSTLSAALEDRLLPGLGVVRVHYDVQTFTPAPGLSPLIQDEQAPLEYVHWRDMRWGWARTFDKLPWLAFRSHLTRDEAQARFPDTPLTSFTFKRRTTHNERSISRPEDNDFWATAEIWEIWDKQTRSVRWFHHSAPQILDKQPDPFHLPDFYPTPPFFIANATTSLLVPVPDYIYAQDLYNQIDLLQTRIAMISQSLRVTGVHDKNAPEIRKMLQHAADNTLIPVDNWALFAERGGIRGMVDWFPLETVVTALVNLRQLRDENIELLRQLVGVNDIMRGNLDNQYEGVEQTRQKLDIGSLLLQHIQNQFTRYTSQLLQLKAAIICRHYDPQTILRKSNADALQEPPELVQAAIQLLKAPDMAYLRVNVTAAGLSDLSARRDQVHRTQYLDALASYFNNLAPLAAQLPAAAPALLQVLQWALASFPDAEEVETRVDQAVNAALQQQQQQQSTPSPEQERANAAVELERVKHQNALQQRQADMQADMQTDQLEHDLKQQEAQATFAADIARLRAKAEADIAVEIAQSQANVEQQRLTAETESIKDARQHLLDLDKIDAETRARMVEIAAETRAQERLTPTQEPQNDS